MLLCKCSYHPNHVTKRCGECMKFIPRELSHGNGIYLDTEGLILGIRDTYIPGSHNENNVFAELADVIEPFKVFKVETYNVLKKGNKNYNWDHVFGSINHFFTLITDDEKRAIAETIISIHYDIVSKMKLGSDLSQNLVDLTGSFSAMIDHLDREIDLCGKLEKYVDEYIPVPDFKNVGNRPQDTTPMTFKKEHVSVLTVFSLISKLFCPILGVFIEHCKKQLDSSLKDLHCVNILSDLLERRYPQIIHKLKNYIMNISKPDVKAKMKYVVHGYTLELATQKNYANILVKKLVGVYLFRENGNLMTYITTSIRECNRTPPFTASSNKCAIEELASPSETSSSSEEGNKSTLECGSRSSDKTVDFPILIKAAANDLIKKIVAEEELNEDILADYINYYKMNLFPFTPMNMYLLANTFSAQLGGAKSIYYLNMDNYIQLISILQMLFIKRGYYDLVSLISLKVANESKDIQTQADGVLKSAWNTSHTYKNCKNYFDISISNVDFDSQLKLIVDSLINNNYLVNMPYAIYESCDWPVINGKIYAYPENIIKIICGYMWDNIVGVDGSFQ